MYNENLEMINEELLEKRIKEKYLEVKCVEHYEDTETDHIYIVWLKPLYMTMDSEGGFTHIVGKTVEELISNLDKILENSPIFKVTDKELFKYGYDLLGNWGIDNYELFRINQTNSEWLETIKNILRRNGVEL